MSITGRKQISLIIMMIILLQLSACTNLFGSNDQETQLLLQQINVLETQNALLRENQESNSQAPAPPSEGSQPEISMASPAEESLPATPVQAGTPIIYQGWTMTVSQELIVFSDGGYWGITIFVRNMGENSRVFRFTNSGITAKDDLGNIYLPSNPSITSVSGLGSGSCEERYHYVKNLEIRAGEVAEINSGRWGYHNCYLIDGIHMFDGPIPLQASQLIIHFEDFGPYSDIDVIINL